MIIFITEKKSESSFKKEKKSILTFHFKKNIQKNI